MKKAIKYLSLTLIFAYLSSGVVISAFQDTYDKIGGNIFWLLVPAVAFFMLAATVNDVWLAPRLLMKKRYGLYCCGVFATSYAVALAGLAGEYGARIYFGLPMRITNYCDPWIFIDSFSNCIMLSLILLSLGMWQLYVKLGFELKREAKMTDRLKNHIAAINSRLNPTLILDKMTDILAALKSTPEVASVKIRELCDYLRIQLYELPAPPPVPIIRESALEHSRVTSFLVERRFKLSRNIIFLLVLAIISFGTFFSTPDQPDFTIERIVSVVFMFLLLAFLAYINILWLYPRFKSNGSVRSYAWSVCIFITAITFPLIMVQIMTYEPNVYDKKLPLVIEIISALGSIITLLLYIGGISAILLLQDWVRTQQRVVLLQAETARQEYAYLRKQINPHFLFNVLNNIGIIAYDDADLSVSLMNSLKMLLTYQFNDISRDYTTVADEAKFLESYLVLEKSRRENFDYTIEMNGECGSAMMPTLLLIPFIENAVKYSLPSCSTPTVDVRFNIHASRLSFKCSNDFHPEDVENMKNGGIGISNTRRRLDLLYDGDYSLTCRNSGKTYCVELEIPLK